MIKIIIYQIIIKKKEDENVLLNHFQKYNYFELSEKNITPFQDSAGNQTQDVPHPKLV